MAPARRPLADRFWEKVDRSGDCWEWTGGRNQNGYGVLWSGGRYGTTLQAHRVAHELLIGPIPQGLEIDHLCENKGCVNPEHLEAVLPWVNAERHSGKQTHCKHGHPLDGVRRTVCNGTAKMQRYCTTCRESDNRRRRERRRAVAA